MVALQFFIGKFTFAVNNLQFRGCIESRLNFFRRKFFLRLTGEEKGFSPEKWRKLEENGENSNEF